ncbi:hypothetical protein [Aeromonas caviae]|uniref:hypothetical protein n=1 Tax=Aeromonas caviae TaxID=648 RepID=UPI002B49A3C9|nr:hypothetical protein [Aeromonas caviae]
MGEQPEISSNSTSRTSPVLPRDYCTIERAARMLSCEAEDILQWGAEGAIPLMVNFDQWVKPIYGEVVDCYGHEREPDDDGVVELAGGRTWYRPTSLADDDDEIIGLDELGGFWCVLKSDLLKSLLGVPIDELKLFAPDLDLIPRGSSQALAMACDLDNPFPTYWISRHSILKIKKHIESGESLQPDSLLLENFLASTKTHPRALASAVDRELILTAAIYVKDKVGDGWFHDPKDTNTDEAKGWAYKVKCNEKRLFDGGVCPLGESKIERILGAAMNQGKPHKSK